MTKAELIERLASFPDSYEVRVSAVVYCPHAEGKDCYYGGMNIGHGKIGPCNPPAPFGSRIEGLTVDDRGVAVLLETTVN